MRRALHSQLAMEHSRAFPAKGVQPEDSRTENTWVWASLVARLVKNPPAIQETPVRSLGRKIPPGVRTGYPLRYSWASLVAQLVKNPPSMRETWVRFLSWKDPLEKETATHSSILAWRIPWSV